MHYRSAYRPQGSTYEYIVQIPQSIIIWLNVYISRNRSVPSTYLF